MRETRVRSLGWEDPMENEMATHSGTLAWRIPWREEPSRLQSMESQRVGQDWATSLSLSFSLEFIKHFLRAFSSFKPHSNLKKDSFSVYVTEKENQRLEVKWFSHDHTSRGGRGTEMGPDSRSVTAISTPFSWGPGCLLGTPAWRHPGNTSLVSVCAQLLQLCPTLCDPMDCSLTGPLSLGFPRKKCWSGLPSPFPGCSRPRDQAHVSCTSGRFFTHRPIWEAHFCRSLPTIPVGFPGGSVVKNPPANAGVARDSGSTPGRGRTIGEGNDNSFQYSCLGNSMDRGAWWATSPWGCKQSDTTERLSTHTLSH